MQIVTLVRQMMAVGLECRRLLVALGGRQAGGLGLAGALRQVVDLQGQVGDAVVVGQEFLQVGADRVAVLARFDEHVRRRGGHPRRDLPDVQVMDLGDVRAAGHRGAEGGQVEPGGRRLEEDPPGGADQPRAGPQHEDHHDQRGDRVGAVEPAGQDDDRGHRGRGERVQVGQHVRDRALYVEAAPPAAAVRPGEQPARRQVDDHPGEGDAKHQAAGYRLGRDKPAHGLVGEPRGEQDQRDAVRLGGEDLQAAQPVGVPAAGRPSRHPGRDEGEPDRRRVGEHVRGIGQQRE